MRSYEFLTELDRVAGTDLAKVNQKLEFIRKKIESGEVGNDPKTVDYIYKILQKPEIQGALSSVIDSVSGSDEDVAKFNKLNKGILTTIIRKLPIMAEELNKFLEEWSTSDGLVNMEGFRLGTRGKLTDLIPNPIAFTVFEQFEKLRVMYRLPKKGSAGYGEFGLAMLSPKVRLQGPGDLSINGNPVEVKGNNARLYADERAVASESSFLEARGDAPGLINNVVAGLQSTDENVKSQTFDAAINAFKARGVSDIEAKNILKDAASFPQDKAVQHLCTEWWRASFNSYTRSIKMPILLIGFGEYMISDKPGDFIRWGCLPKSISAYGYMYGRQAGQSRETYPKIFVPGHNK